MLRCRTKCRRSSKAWHQVSPAMTFQQSAATLAAELALAKVQITAQNRAVRSRLFCDIRPLARTVGHVALTGRSM